MTTHQHDFFIAVFLLVFSLISFIWAYFIAFNGPVRRGRPSSR